MVLVETADQSNKGLIELTFTHKEPQAFLVDLGYRMRT
jgi:hypothetical protein